MNMYQRQQELSRNENKILHLKRLLKQDGLTEQQRLSISLRLTMLRDACKQLQIDIGDDLRHLNRKRSNELRRSRS